MQKNCTTLRLQSTDSNRLVPHDADIWKSVSPCYSQKLWHVVELELDLTLALLKRLQSKGTMEGHDVHRENFGDVEAIVNFIMTLNSTRFPALKTVRLMWLVVEEYRDDTRTVFSNVKTELKKNNLTHVNVELKVVKQPAKWLHKAAVRGSHNP